MNSDFNEDLMVDDWLTAKQDLLDTSDEELNDDLLRSDEENETMRCNDENISQPKLQAIAKPFLVCRTSHLAKDQAMCAKEEQIKIEVDPDEVLDIEINAPSGDEFQSGAELPKGQPAPEETLTGPCCSPEPRFPGQHMFDQQHPASVLDTNPLLAGPSPKGSFQPPGYERDPWRPRPTLQGLVGQSKPGSPQPAHNPLQNRSSAQSFPLFTDPSGPRAQKPAVLVRAVARMESKAKPMAVARGMPVAAKQPASAKFTISAKTPPEPGMMRKNVGQKVKEEPQTLPALQKHPVTPLNIKNNEECGDEDKLYRQRLKKQIQMRKEIFRQKEQRRRLRAINKKNQLPVHPQTYSQTCWKNNQQKHPFGPPGPQKVQHQPSSHNPPLCSVQNPHLEYQPVPQQHQYHVLVATPQPPEARVISSDCPHLLGTERMVFPDHKSQHYSNAWVSQAQDVWKGGRRMLGMRDSDLPVPPKFRVIKHFNPSARQESAQFNITPQMNEDFREEIKTKSRVVTFTRPGSFLQHGPRLLCTNQMRVFTPNQSQLKVPVRENEDFPFIPCSSGMRTESVAAQSDVNFIVRLNH